MSFIKIFDLERFSSLAKSQASFEGQVAPAGCGLRNRSKIVVWISSYEKHLASQFLIKIKIKSL